MPINRTLANYIASNPNTASTSRASGVWTLDEHGSALAQNTWPVPPNIVQRSLRFNSADSAYLNRTPAVAGNQKTFTFSCWLKRSKINDATALFSTVSGSAFTYLSFGTGGGGDQLQFAYYNGSSDIFNVSITSAQFRDPSAWYHIVLAVDTTLSANRVRLYVNNIEPALGGTQPTQNYDIPINSTIAHFIGGATGSYTAYHSDGYMTEINFVDGQQLTPSSFGETDPQTGVWIPKPYVGTYGTNGFRLNFSNNSSTTALGYDSSGNGNNWTANNFSVTPGTGNDSLVDVPSLYGWTDTGVGGEVRGNYCTTNPLAGSTTGTITYSNGNLDFVLDRSANNCWVTSTFAIPSSGKWYFEVSQTATNTGTTAYGFVGVMDITTSRATATPTEVRTYIFNSGNKTSTFATGGSSYGAAVALSDIVGVAIDMDAGTITFYKNGVSQGIAFSDLVSSGKTWAFTTFLGGNNTGTFWANFGQRPFAYTAPTGFKALCTTNLSAPAVGQTSDNQADNHFQAVTYSGNGSTQSISTLQFQPDFVWIKNRTGANSHILVDAIRGAGKGLSTESTTAEYNIPTAFQSFNQNGFTVGYDGSNITNATSNNYVAWCWNAGGTTVTNTTGTISAQVRANQRAGFSIVNWTGTGAVGTIGHGLGTAPSMIIVKSRSATDAWYVYHKSLGATVRIQLNETSAQTTGTTVWNSTSPTSSVFSIGNGNPNSSAVTYLAYCWAAIPGFSAFGSYVGNGSADGPFVYLGFRPRFILLKSSSVAATNWQINDTARDTYNIANKRLSPSTTDAEATTFNFGDILSNGFKIRQTDQTWNSNGGTYIYAAFAEHPTRLATAR